MQSSKGTSHQRPLAPYLILSVLVVAFFATFLNRFAGLRSGSGEYSGGLALLSGRLPYRDYFTAGPPLNTLKSALLLKLFGPTLLVSRVAGVLERVLLGCLLFRWLRQIAPGRYALVAAIVTIVLSAGDSTDPIASYNHDAIFWAVLAGLLASFSLRDQRRLLKFSLLTFSSGVAAAFSALTKQTVGLAVMVCLLATVPVLLPTWRLRARWAAAFLLGCTPPVIAVGLALAHLGVLRAAVQMLFVSGPAAKAGHPGDFFLRIGLVAWDNFGWLSLGSFTLLLLWRPLRRAADSRFSLNGGDGTDSGAHPGSRFLTRLLITGLAVIGAAELLRSLPALHDFTKSAVYFCLFACFVIAVRMLPAFLRRTLNEAEEQVALLLSVSLAISLALALSWPAFEAMLLPGLGPVLAIALISVRSPGRRWFYAGLVLAVVMQVREKLDLPFAFNLQEEAPVREATETSKQPALRGMLLPPATVHFIDDVAALVRTHTTPEDTIFTYPELGLVYSLTNRNPPTFAASHNIDVVNDALAHVEAERLLRSRPAVLIRYRLSEEEQQGAERLWRHSQPSGQRELARVVEQLASTYHLVGTYRLTPEDPPIEVYLKP